MEQTTGFDRAPYFLLLFAAHLPAADRPQWRGPEGNGVSAETGLPAQWSARPGEEKGIAWKRELPGWGTSTPAVLGDAVFVTSQRDDALLLLRISKRTGATEWETQVGSGEAERMQLRLKSDDERRRQKFHGTHNLASPSPVTDGERVVVHFGNGELASYDLAGNRQWGRNLVSDHGAYTIWWGHANSPVLHENLVISACMQDSLADLPGKPSESYIVAHDKRTGEQAWKAPRMTGARSEPCDAYTTPLLRRWENGARSENGLDSANGARPENRVEVLVMGGGVLDAYDPATGQRLWWLPGLGGNRTITGPTIAHGMVFSTIGMRGALLAVKLGRKGELPAEDVVWRHAKGTPDSPSPVVWGDHIYIVSDNGIATALDARTGKVHWTERLDGDHRASPVAAEGRVYFLSMTGLTTVVAASSRFEKLAENPIDDETIASPAISGGRIFLRGKKALYCVETGGRSPAGR